MTKHIKYVSVYNKIFEMIQNKTFAPNEKLPSEHELAKLMHVSRMTLRKALSLLQEDNLISNRAGIGNFVNDRFEDHTPCLNTFNPIYKYTNKKLDKDLEIAFRIEPPSISILNSLKRNSSAVVIVDRWFKSMDVFCIYSLSFIPIEIIANDNVDLSNIDNLKTYLDSTCYKNNAKSVCILGPSNAGNFTATKYKISNKDNFILINETIYTKSGEIALVSKHYIPFEEFSLRENIDFLKEEHNE